MIVHSTVGRYADMQGDIQRVDFLFLSAEQRQRPHMRVHTSDGREIAISLSRGSELEDGDVLAIEGRVAIVVAAAPEDVLEIIPVTPREWGVAAYQLGNLHREVRFLDTAMLTLYDRTCAEVLEGLKVPFKRVQRGFIGTRYGAYTGPLHEQEHEHSHDGHHGHEHHH